MSLANEPARTCLAAVVGIALALPLALGGCDCDAEGRELTRTPATSTQGAESRPAIAYPTAQAARPATAFEVVPEAQAPGALGAATRAGAWSALRRGGVERRSAGNFLCRLETLYGRAPIVLGDRVAFVLQDQETGILLTASADPSGPSFGAVLPPGESGPEPAAQTSAAEAVLALATLLDATAPRDCQYTLGGRDVGVRDGQWF